MRRKLPAPTTAAPTSPTRRARSPSEVTTDRSVGSPSDSTSAAMSSSAALGPRREANRTVTRSPPSMSNGLPSRTTVTGSSLLSANACSSSTSLRMAPGRSRHQPVGREPITFMPSTIQRVTAVAPRRPAPSPAAPHEDDDGSHQHEPRRELDSQGQASALVAGGVANRREQDRRPEEHHEGPEHGVSLHARTIPPASLDRRDPQARPRRRARRPRDRVLGNPRAAGRRVALHGGLLPLRVRAARACTARVARGLPLWGAGVMFAADLTLWHHSIEAVGAGLATVLGNVQVVLVALLAWLALGERPDNRALASIPVVFAGVILISGVIGSGAYGDDPLMG